MELKPSPEKLKDCSVASTGYEALVMTYGGVVVVSAGVVVAGAEVIVVDKV